MARQGGVNPDSGKTPQRKTMQHMDSRYQCQCVKIGIWTRDPQNGGFSFWFPFNHKSTHTNPRLTRPTPAHTHTHARTPVAPPGSRSRAEGRRPRSSNAPGRSLQRTFRLSPDASPKDLEKTGEPFWTFTQSRPKRETPRLKGRF